MWRFAPYILKSLWRHRTRTLLTVCGAAVALFVYTVLGSVRDGLDALTRGVEADRTLIVFQASRFCPFTSRLPEHYATAIAKMSGVRDVVPVQVYMNNCRASLDVIVFNGLPPSLLKEARNITVTEGSLEEFERGYDGAMVGQALAARRRLKIGQKFSVGELSVTVVGIFSSRDPGAENFVYVPLSFLQRTKGINTVGVVTQFEVRLKEGADAKELARAIDMRYRGGPVATDTRTKGAFQARAVGDLLELLQLARYLGYACIALVLALVATTTVMAVQDRVREHAVLQTLGFTPAKLFGMVLMESLLVSLAGGLVGIGLSTGILAWQGLYLSTEGVVIPIASSLELALTGMAVTCVVGVLAGLAPAWRAARAEIVTSLRQV